jgi:hypothetical protein
MDYCEFDCVLSRQRLRRVWYPKFEREAGASRPIDIKFQEKSISHTHVYESAR